MKTQVSRLLSAVLCLAGILSAASCERADFGKMPEFVKNITVTMEDVDFSSVDDSVIDASGTPQTKVDYTVVGSRIDFSWSDEGDVVGIYPIGGDQVAFPLSSSSGASANFDGGSWALRTSFRYAAYYPFAKEYYGTEATSLPISYVGQKQVGDNSLDHLSPYSFMASMASSPDSRGNISIDLKHIGAWVQIRAVVPAGMKVNRAVLKDKTGSLIVGGEMDLTQTASGSDDFVPTLNNPKYAGSITLDVDGITGTGAAAKLWMMLPPQDLTGHELELTLYAEGDGAVSTSTIPGKNLPRAVPTVLKFNDTYKGSEADYLCFTAENQNVNVSLQFIGSGWTQTFPKLQYSVSGNEWKDYRLGTSIQLRSVGDKVRFRGDNSHFSQDAGHFLYFSVSGPTAVSGNVMTLVDASGLSLAIPAANAFISLFSDCGDITSAPELPATTLTPHCYQNMFEGCYSLVEAPYLPATVLADGCYERMFYGCSWLRSVNVNFSEWGDDTTGWLEGVADEGTIICPQTLPRLSGTSFIPEGWAFLKEDEEPVNYLCFTAEAAESVISLVSVGEFYTRPFPAIEYSFDGKSWRVLTVNATQIRLSNVGDKVFLRGDNAHFSYGPSQYLSFEMTGRVAASGNLMTLLDKKGQLNEVEQNYEFLRLFYHCNALTMAPELPATSLTEYCYSEMFCGCKNLIVAPELPATTLANSCYESMFSACSRLATAPSILPATTLKPNCYDKMFFNCESLLATPEISATTTASKCCLYMFSGCTSLKAAPLLPAMSLAENCYENMFSYCTGIVDVASLPATELQPYCYGRMFAGCTSLKNVPSVLPATNLTYSLGCYYSMFSECTSLTEAPALPSTRLGISCYQDMFKGCTSLTAAPDLPATELVRWCYMGMFSGCTKLKTVRVSFTEWQVSLDATDNWLEGVPSTGSFFCPSSLVAYRGVNGIPAGWTKYDN